MGQHKGQPGKDSRRTVSGFPSTPAGSLHCAHDLAAACQRLLSENSRTVDAAALREALCSAHEAWLTAQAHEIGISGNSGVAIIATGGVGRREYVPYSDLDLMLLHDDMPEENIAEIANMLWYPLWDANIRLDHSVRTPAEALRVASAEISVGMAMLEARHIAGDGELSARLISSARLQWRRNIMSRYDELIHTTHQRWQRSGHIAHRGEPDLKNGQGGLRDIHVLNALAMGQLADEYPHHSSALSADSLNSAHATLLNVRTELRRLSQRGRDQLHAQFADEIAAALHLGDRCDLARAVSHAARTVSFCVDASVRIAAHSSGRRGLRNRLIRHPLDEGVVEFAGEITLARNARPEHDPGLLIRVAAGSATTGLPICTSTLNRLADTAVEPSMPWRRDVLEDFLVLLAAGPAVVPTIEVLDRMGLWGKLFPEWDAVRDLPPRDAIHTWTVDRHLMETVIQAASLTTRVSRPDLLLLAALLHDIGKGHGGDHSVIGAQLVAQVGARLGLWPSDIRLLAAVVRHHLLLPSVAARHDIHDQHTITTVVECIDGDPVVLELLHALAEADSLATGPGVWSTWKAALIGDLVQHCRLMMAGEPLPEADVISPQHRSRADTGRIHVEITPTDNAYLYSVTMIAPNTRGVLSKEAAVLALNSLQVHSASVTGTSAAAVNTFVVSPHFGSAPPAELLSQQLNQALNNELDVLACLEQRRRDRKRFGSMSAAEVTAFDAPAVPINSAVAPPRILWHDSTSDHLPSDTSQYLLAEIRTVDYPGLLAVLTGVCERAGADIAWAKITTRGSSVIDIFAFTAETVRSPSERAHLEQQLYEVLPNFSGDNAAATSPES